MPLLFYVSRKAAKDATKDKILYDKNLASFATLRAIFTIIKPMLLVRRCSMPLSFQARLAESEWNRNRLS